MKKLLDAIGSFKERRRPIEISRISERSSTGKRILFPFYNLGLGDKIFFEVVLRKYSEANREHYLIGLENHGGLSMADYPVPPDEVWKCTRKQSQFVGENARLRAVIERNRVDKLVICHDWLYGDFARYSIDREYRNLWRELQHWKRRGAYPRLNVPSSARRWAANFLRRQGIDGPLVTIHLRNQSWDKWRNLDFEKYLQVIDWIVQERHVTVVVVGREEENPKVESPGVLDVSKASLTVFQTAAIIERSLLFIGTDTGPTHLAVSLRIPVVYTDMTNAGPGALAPAGSYAWVPRRALCWPDSTRPRTFYRGAAIPDILGAVDSMMAKASRSVAQSRA